MITACVEFEDGNEEFVEFEPSEVLVYNNLDITWNQLGNTDSVQQMSLAEDYALYSFYRRFGNNQELRVEIVSGLTGDKNE